MLSYLKYIFCLSAIASCVEIKSEHLDLNSAGQNYSNHQVTTRNKVDVKVYYEALCPACKDLFTTDLNDTYAKIGSYIDLKTYPYGNAYTEKVNEKTEIVCQHGSKECHGNKLHACAIDILNSVPRSLYYVSCMMMDHWGGYGSTDIEATKCGQLMNIDSKPIIECANGAKGKSLLEYYGQETDKASINQTPWIVINGKVYDIAHETESIMEKVCEALADPPAKCEQE